MALDFPVPGTQTPINTWSPTSTPSASTNGLTYLWDGQKWGSAGSTPNVEWNEITGKPDFDALYVETAGDEMSGNLTVPSLNGGQLAGFRNKLINSDFRIWQRGGVFSNLAALNSGIEYTADHVFVHTVSASSGAIEFDRGSVTGLEGFAGCLQNNTNVTAYVSFPIELDRLGGFASPFIVGKTYTASWYQTDSTQLGNNLQFKVSSDASSFTAECTEVGALKAESTGVGTWTRYSQSFTMVDPSGASPTLLALTVLVGGGQSITGAQLEPGPVATPYEHRPIQTELALCQRYYQTFTGRLVYGRWYQAAGDAKAFYYYPVTMRVPPTITNTKQDETYNQAALFVSPTIYGCESRTPDSRGSNTIDFWSVEPKFDAEL